MSTLPQESSRASIAFPRWIAALLALGGSFWGVFLLLAFGPGVLVVPPTTAGFVVTAGYWFRAVTVPPMNIRRLIWVASILVQGGWSCVGIADLPGHGPNL